jgi:hypothetical protein
LESSTFLVTRAVGAALVITLANMACDNRTNASSNVTIDAKMRMREILMMLSSEIARACGKGDVVGSIKITDEILWNSKHLYRCSSEGKTLR